MAHFPFGRPPACLGRSRDDRRGQWRLFGNAIIEDMGRMFKCSYPDCSEPIDLSCLSVSATDTLSDSDAPPRKSGSPRRRSEPNRSPGAQREAPRRSSAEQCASTRQRTRQSARSCRISAVAHVDQSSFAAHNFPIARQTNIARQRLALCVSIA